MFEGQTCSLRRAFTSFEGRQLGQRLLLCWLVPDTHQFGLDGAALSSRDSIEHIALFMHQTALAGRSRKEFFQRSQQSVMAISDHQINLGRSSSAQVLEQASPSIFVLLGAGSQC